MYPDKGKYIGSWKNYKLDGKGTYIYPDKGKYIGSWKNDKKNGKGTDIYFNKDKDKCSGTYKNGKLTKGTCIYKNGSICKGTYKNGKLNGRGTCRNKKEDTLGFHI
jgi:hypothetical protein